MTHKFVPKNRNLKIGKYFAHKCGVWSSQINDSKMPKWAPSSIHRSPQLFLLLPVQHCAKFSVVKHAQGFYAVGNMIKCQIIDLNYQIDLKLCGESVKFSLCEGNFKGFSLEFEFSIRFEIKQNCVCI